MSITRNPVFLSYQNQEAILQYLDANKRLQLSLLVPSLRTLDRKIPLRLKSLTFDGNSMEIDGIKYNVVIKRETGENGIKFSDVTTDVDDFGFKVAGPSCELAEGDKAFDFAKFVQDSREADEMIRSEKARKELISSFKPHVRHIYWDSPVLMKKILLELMPFYYARHNIKPEYEAFVELQTKANSSEDSTAKSTLYRGEYKKPLWYYAKNLRDVFF